MTNRTRSCGASIGVVTLIVGLALTTACRRETTTAAQTAAPEQTVATRTVTVPVDGMICQVCAGTVKSALKKVDGVQDAEISLEKRNAVVHYDARKVTLDELTRAIKEAGYKPGVPTPAVSQQ